MRGGELPNDPHKVSGEEWGVFFVPFNVPHILIFRDLMDEGEIRWLSMLWVVPCFNLELGIWYIRFRGLELVCGPWTPNWGLGRLTVLVNFSSSSSFFTSDHPHPICFLTFSVLYYEQVVSYILTLAWSFIGNYLCGADLSLNTAIPHNVDLKDVREIFEKFMRCDLIQI